MTQLIRFSVVGFLNFAISYSVFYLLIRFFPFSALQTYLPASLAEGVAASLRLMKIPSIDAAAANLVGYAAGMLNSFVWNKLWTFKAAQNTRRQAQRFIVTNMACLLLSTAALFVCTDLYQLPFSTVWFVTMALITILNYLLCKHWVFAQ